MKELSKEEWNIIYQTAIKNFKISIKACLLRYYPHKYTTDEADEIASDLVIPLIGLISIYMEDIIVQYNQEKILNFIHTPPSNLN